MSLNSKIEDLIVDRDQLRGTIATLRAALTTTSEGNARLIVQRDELLEVLKNSRATLERANEKYGAIRDTIWHTQHETLFDFMDAAITKEEERNA